MAHSYWRALVGARDIGQPLSKKRAVVKGKVRLVPVRKSTYLYARRSTIAALRLATGLKRRCQLKQFMRQIGHRLDPWRRLAFVR
jgi:hypothetical protein